MAVFIFIYTGIGRPCFLAALSINHVTTFHTIIHARKSSEDSSRLHNLESTNAIACHWTYPLDNQDHLAVL